MLSSLAQWTGWIMEDLWDIFPHEKQKIREKIQESSSQNLPLLTQVTSYLLEAGGKGIRPWLTIACSKLFEEEVSDQVIHLACAIELLHTATLFHDDVIDQSEFRRGRPTVHTVWDIPTSVLAGDFLFSKAFEHLIQTQDFSIMEAFSRTATILAEGQMLELFEGKNPDLTLETYFKIIGSKTAQLFGFSCQSAAQLNDKAPQQDKDLLFDFGHALGMAFQIRDDLLDYMDGPHSHQKKRGNDFREGRMTLPLLLDSSKQWAPDIGKPEKFEETVKRLDQEGIFDQCRIQQKIFLDKALLSLDSLSLSFKFRSKIKHLLDLLHH